MPHLTPSTFAVAFPAARRRFGLRKSTWTTLLLASLMATLGAVCSEPAKAVPINIIVTGTITSADAGIGYAVGDTVSFAWQVNDFPPPPTVNVGTDKATYSQENISEPTLWSNVSGTGISGTYAPLSTGSQPFSLLHMGWASSAANVLSPKLAADAGIGSSVNHGIFLTADPTYFIDELSFSGGLTGVGFASISQVNPPTPAAYLANYSGTYTTFSASALESSRITASNGSNVKTAFFSPLSVQISPEAVPEIDPAGMGSVLALVGGALGLLERRRRPVA